MSLPGFDTLRAKHPAERATIAQLESYIETTLRRDAEAVLDDAIIEQHIPGHVNSLRQFLAELVERGALETRFFWICPTTEGATMEAPDIGMFPSVTECSQCGDRHVFSQRDIEVYLVPSNQIKQLIMMR